VFEPFVTSKPANVGSGLGLYVCHQLVTKMRGQIEVARTGSDGTVIRVTLPVQ
jgi:two-component system, NtrC family, sensor kinase